MVGETNYGSHNYHVEEQATRIFFLMEYDISMAMNLN